MGYCKGPLLMANTAVLSPLATSRKKSDGLLCSSHS